MWKTQNNVRKDDARCQIQKNQSKKCWKKNAKELKTKAHIKERIKHWAELHKLQEAKEVEAQQLINLFNSG